MPQPRLPAEAEEFLRAASRLSPEPVFLVGGAVRDLRLGRPAEDLDLAVADASRAQGLAKALARELGAALVVLDEQNAVYRVALPRAPTSASVRQIDVAALQGRTIEEDLARRDFTINAMALPLGRTAGEVTGRLLDPRQGLKDLEQKLIRAEAEELFASDPLRLLRAFRIAAQLDFTIEPATLSLIARLKHRVLKPAAERVRSELMALLSIGGCSRWLRLMDETGVLTALFEEMEAARRCAEVYYGPGGVLTHSLDTAARADFLLHGLKEVFPRHADKIEGRLKERSQGPFPHQALLLLCAFLHDIAKAETARTVDGRLRFFGHDTLGSVRAAGILKRLRFSRDEIDTASVLIANHLRPGHLAASDPVTDKAAYRFFRDLGQEALSLLLLCWADHASYLPTARLLKLLKEPGLARGAEERRTLRHLQVISQLMDRLFDAPEKTVPERLVDGHDVMQALGLSPGPQIGEWLESIREAQAEGKIKNREEALEFLRSDRPLQ